jgi:hypothetical protein
MGSAPNLRSDQRSSTLLGRPSGGPAGYLAHGRSPGSRRIADAAFPGFSKSPVARKASTRRSQSRGRPRIDESLPCSLFTLGRNRGTVPDLCHSFARGCQMDRRDRRAAMSTLRASLTAPVKSRLQTSRTDRPGPRRADLRAIEGASLEARITFASPTTPSSWLPRRRRPGSGGDSQRPLKDLPRRKAFRRIGAPFRAATRRARPERPAMPASCEKNRKTWR